MTKRIYADNAATTALSKNAYNAMMPYLLEEYGNASQLYSFARNPKKAIREARATIADCIGAIPEEIIFTSCGTESDNWVIYGAVSQKLSVITSSIEHHAILRPCEYFSEQGITVKFIPVDSKGIVNCSILNNEICSKDTLISVMCANNEIGSIQPINKIAEISHSKGCLFHTDAVQAVGHLNINVKDLGIDLLSASAHKFNGPKGIGFLYIRKGVVLPSFIMGGSQESGHRAGTENVASIVGMAVALQENVNQLQENANYLYNLENILLSELSQSGIFFIRNGAIEHIPGNISLSFPNLSGETLLHRLDLQGISVSTGSACDSRDVRISHVLEAIGLEEKTAKGTIRISLGKNNTVDEAIIIAKKIKNIIGMY